MCKVSVCVFVKTDANVAYVVQSALLFLLLITRYKGRYCHYLIHRLSGC